MLLIVRWFMKKKCFLKRIIDLIIRQHKYIQGFGLAILATGTLIPPIKNFIAVICGLNFWKNAFSIILILIFCVILIYVIFVAGFDTEILKKEKMDREELMVSSFLAIILGVFLIVVCCG